MSELTQIATGRIYRAKVVANRHGFYNDRLVMRVIGKVVQYDGPAVRNGRRYPMVPLRTFLSWAAEDVTDKMPPGEWQAWPGTPEAIDQAERAKEAA